MNDTLITILSLSISGSILALILFVAKPIIKNRVSKAFSYYIWLLVLIRLVLPVAAPVSTLDFLSEAGHPQSSTIVEQAGIPVGNEIMRTDEQMVNSFDLQTVLSGPQNVNTSSTLWSSVWNLILNNLLWIWLAGFIVSVSWFVMAYELYSRHIRHSFSVPHRDDLAVFEQMCGNKHLRMTCSSCIDTPMLIGIAHPIIVIPQNSYVQSGMKEELTNTLLHELTHYRRKDVLYKWMLAIATSVHWFNPLMLLIRKEIASACELSCDEAVISEMSAAEKKSYGNTLLALSAKKKLPLGVLSTTLCEGKKELKERLISIMKFKRKSLLGSVLAITLALILTACGAAIGPASSQADKAVTEASNTAASTVASNTVINNPVTVQDIKDDNFTGKLMIIPNPLKVKIGYSLQNGSPDKTTSEMAKELNAVGAVNAGGYKLASPDESVPVPLGFIIKDGKTVYSDQNDENITQNVVGFTNEGKLLVGAFTLSQLEKNGVSDAICSRLTLISDGASAIKDSVNKFGIGPQTAIGQKADGTVLLLVIDGRKADSLGASQNDVESILSSYGAVNAALLDGGSSSTMYYNGTVINHPSYSKGERLVPSSFVVLQ